MAAMVAVACGQQAGSCGGCSWLQPLPQGTFTGDVIDSAASGRVTAKGFGALNGNSGLILNALAPDGGLTLPLKCSVQSVSLLGNITVGDEGTEGCTAESCGQLDGKCDAKDVPRTIDVVINAVALSPKGPDLVSASLDVTLHTGKIMVSSVNRQPLACALLGGGPIKCGFDLDTARANPTSNSLDVSVRFTADTRWGELLNFEITQVAGTKVCGSLGAPPSPACIDGADTVVSTEGACSICAAADFGPIKSVLLDQIANVLKDKLSEALAGANCLTCLSSADCPRSGTSQSSCRFDPDAGTPDAGRCEDTFTGRCVPRALGLQGRLLVGSLLERFGAEVSRTVDVSLVAGGQMAASDAGFTIGFLGGATEAQVASCVKPLVQPAVPSLPLAALDPQAPGPYDVGAAVSSQLIDRALFHAQQSGALCLQLSSEQVSVLDSSVLSTLLPSLDKLTHGANVPVKLVLRPTTAPTATVLAGDELPLLELNWAAAEIDLYALLEERSVRLLTLSADFALPFSVEVSPCATLTFLLGPLSRAVKDVRVLNHEMLAEDVASLVSLPDGGVGPLVPSLLALAEPALAKGLGEVSIPPLGQFQLELLSARGVGPVPGTNRFSQLGLYADLRVGPVACRVAPPGGLMLQAASTADSAGVATELFISAPARATALSYRVDRGLWSVWQAPTVAGRMSVDHPSLQLRGGHLIEVRARDAALNVIAAGELKVEGPGSVTVK